MVSQLYQVLSQLVVRGKHYFFNASLKEFCKSVVTELGFFCKVFESILGNEVNNVLLIFIETLPDVHEGFLG